MNINKILGDNKYILAVAIPILIILFPLGYSVVASVFTQSAEIPQMFLEKPDPEHKNCIKDTQYMRYHHWELLRETRKKVVRYGIREDVELSGCKECHTSRERFCDKCHNAVNLYPDCFGCHYYPESPQMAPLEVTLSKPVLSPEQAALQSNSPRGR